MITIIPFPIPEPTPGNDDSFGWTKQTVPGQVFTEVALRASSADVAGRAWVVNLAGWKSTGQRGALNMATLSVQVDVGTAGGTESFLVDWPVQGISFVCHGAQIRVSVNGQALGPVSNTAQGPILSMWLGIDASGRNAYPMNVTLTESTIAIAGSGTQPYTVPIRARAFRLIFTSPAGGASFTTDQLDGNSIGVGADAGGPPPSGIEPSSRQAWYPLHPRATQLTVSDASGAGISIAVQWLLDTTA